MAVFARFPRRVGTPRGTLGANAATLPAGGFPAVAEQLPRVRGLAGKLLMERFIGARVGPCRRPAPGLPRASRLSRNRLGAREVHVPAERNAAGAHAVDDAEFGAGCGIVQPWMTEQGADRHETDRIPP